jgi:hypothetical protein
MASVFFDALVPQVTLKTVGSSAAVQVSSVTQLVMAFTIEARSSNTGILYVGGSNVQVSLALHLSAGDSYSPPVIYAGGTNAREYDLNEWYIRGSAAGLKANILKIRKANQV